MRSTAMTATATTTEHLRPRPGSSSSAGRHHPERALYKARAGSNATSTRCEARCAGATPPPPCRLFLWHTNLKRFKNASCTTLLDFEPSFQLVFAYARDGAHTSHPINNPIASTQCVAWCRAPGGAYMAQASSVLLGCSRTVLPWLFFLFNIDAHPLVI